MPPSTGTFYRPPPPGRRSLTGRGSLTLLHVRGIPLRLHWTLGLMILYVTWVVSAQFALLAHKMGAGTLPPIAWGLLLSIGLFVGVTLHELAHSFVALAYGGRVRAITLTFIGGISEIEAMGRRPREEALIAVVGPLVSLVLGGLAYIATQGLAPEAHDVRAGLLLFGKLNLALALFNLVPAFPLDGGRVLRALLRSRMGPLRATAAAATIGKVFAVLLALLALVGNWTLLFIGLFLWIAADAELRGERMREAMGNMVVADLMEPIPSENEVDLGEGAASTALRMVAERRTWLAVRAQGQIAGLVQAKQLAHLPAEALAGASVGAGMEPVTLVSAETPVSQALSAMQEQGAPAAIVLRGDQVVGILWQEAVLKAVEMHELELALRRRDRLTPQTL